MRISALRPPHANASVDRTATIGVNILCGRVRDTPRECAHRLPVASVWSNRVFVRLSICAAGLQYGWITMLAHTSCLMRLGLLLLGMTVATTTAHAQSKGGKLGSPLGGFGGLPGMNAVGPQNTTFEAEYQLASDGQAGRVSVTVTIADGWHMYSNTQPDGGPLATKLELTAPQLTRSGPFIPDHAPEISSNKVWPGLPIEEHHGQVTWTAPFSVSQGFNPDEQEVQVSLDGQVCTDGGACVPLSEKLIAKFAGNYELEEQLPETLRIDGTQATWTAQISPSQLRPGGLAVLSLKADVDEGYHVYPFVEEETEYRTVIVATAKSGLRFGAPQTDAAIELDRRLETPIAYHAGDVTWQIPIKIPDTAQPGEYPVELMVGFVTCNDRACSARSGLSVSGQVVVAADAAAAPDASSAVTPLRFSQVAYLEVVDRPSLTDWIDQTATQSAATALAGGSGLELWMVLAALAGGFILNFMPCVLPVIGLKLMSFVNQSGSSHARVISLNLSYVAGILSVMLVLALANVLAKTAGDAFGWGQQFTRLEFQVPMAVLIFAMALSFLGVWEIPIPGFSTSSKSGKLMEQEGLTGAFFKGILTTLLATPCSGPFLGTLFGLTLTLSITSILLLYLLVGIGLGLPYLAICLYPQAIRWLPKPGAWMDTLKQILAFPLLLTVVYFVAMIAPDYRIATLTLLIVVWFACWLIGRVPAYAEAYRLRSAWLAGAATILIGAVASFAFLGPIHHDVPWIPYNEATLAKHRSEGKTVMVEFTARWCLTCQTNMKFAIDRPRVAELLDENGVVPLLADWSEPSEEIFSKIKELESLSIPLLAIYPADPTQEPIVLRDAITESQLIEALKEAGPSQSKTKLTGVMH